jgi:hypothetical protein
VDLDHRGVVTRMSRAPKRSTVAATIRVDLGGDGDVCGSRAAATPPAADLVDDSGRPSGLLGW